jgi:Fuc2NAc and GlcNAc transferase
VTTIELMIFMAVVVATAAGCTLLVRRETLRRGILDHPNERSSHVIPTPRGGGIAIVVVASFALTLLWVWKLLGTPLLVSLLAGGGAVALAGYLDDRGHMSVRARMIVHFCSAILAVWLLGGVRQLDLGFAVVSLGFAGDVLSVLGIVWALNLFNFMDGIDGIAGAEAVFVCLVGAVLGTLAGTSPSVPLAASVLAAATLGFLVWNWPPARIFMGDVGSGYLGYCLAVLALAAARELPVLLNAWLVLAGIFMVDATVVLVRRLARRERVYQAHRSHAYQRLARRWNSHARVTLAVTALNVLLLAPLAWACVARPDLAMLWMAAAILPLTIIALLVGAGGKEP